MTAQLPDAAPKEPGQQLAEAWAERTHRRFQ